MEGMSRTRVLFVCLGNICRSPLAEGAARKLARERGLLERFDFDSAATAGYHEGEPYDPRVEAVLKRQGALFEHRARRIRAEDYRSFDWILGMDEENLRDLQRSAPAGARARIALVTEPWGGGRVTDPYYQDDWACEQTYLELEDLVGRWLDLWQEGGDGPAPSA
ncbi:MAG TPA: low molecular weight phosphotyrosine protein phosphatase [Oceanithermus profundus]|uniref:protein-tyrosine-phosphatase n=1 Tax=Oceanithermus profundus TaxID=187137 RepID=A0A7C4Z930_9DEIN|nr:low molecular weight phosphotyrosine protein phosphatase [Oceanithermus profundus]